jgi:hypothetical protein
MSRGGSTSSGGAGRAICSSASRIALRPATVKPLPTEPTNCKRPSSRPATRTEPRLPRLAPRPWLVSRCIATCRIPVSNTDCGCRYRGRIRRWSIVPTCSGQRGWAWRSSVSRSSGSVSLPWWHRCRETDRCGSRRGAMPLWFVPAWSRQGRACCRPSRGPPVSLVSARHWRWRSSICLLGRRPSGEPVIGSTGSGSARWPWPRWG